MPLVHYYQGRPASTWIMAMSRGTRAAPANPAGGTSPSSRQPATPAVRRSVPAGIGTRAVVPAGAWEAWAANWFTPYRLPLAQLMLAAGPWFSRVRPGRRVPPRLRRR